MAFTPNIPASGQSLGSSRTQVLNNFSNINTTIAVNHIAMNSVGAGKHNFVEMPSRASIPSGLLAGEGTLYSRTIAGTTQLLYTPDASGNQYQLTRTDGAQFATFGTNTAYLANHTGGWTFLPGQTGGGNDGLFFQYGLRSSAGSSGVITFPRPFTGAPFAITVSLLRNSGDQSVCVSTVVVPTATGFNYLSSSTGSSIYWTAIGI